MIGVPKRDTKHLHYLTNKTQNDYYWYLMKKYLPIKILIRYRFCYSNGKSFCRTKNDYYAIKNMFRFFYHRYMLNVFVNNSNGTVLLSEPIWCDPIWSGLNCTVSYNTVRIRSDRIGSDRIGSDRIRSTQIKYGTVRIFYKYIFKYIWFKY